MPGFFMVCAARSRHACLPRPYPTPDKLRPLLPGAVLRTACAIDDEGDTLDGDFCARMTAAHACIDFWKVLIRLAPIVAGRPSKMRCAPFERSARIFEKQTMIVLKEILPDRRVQLSCDGCTFIFQRLRPGALLVTINGFDAGQFGTGVLDEFRLELSRYSPLELFIDAQNALGVAVDVSQEWTRFFSTHRQQLKRVSVLVGSKMMQLTVAISQHLSQTGNLIQIYSDPEVFRENMARASGRT